MLGEDVQRGCHRHGDRSVVQVTDPRLLEGRALAPKSGGQAPHNEREVSNTYPEITVELKIGLRSGRNWGWVELDMHRSVPLGDHG
jgi:hypothetical protein